MALSQKVVTPVKTGVQVFCKSMSRLDSGFRRNDGKGAFGLFARASNLLPCDSSMSYSEKEDVESHKSVLRYLRPESQRRTTIVLPRHSPLRS